jgi:hypothetical protein
MTYDFQDGKGEVPAQQPLDTIPCGPPDADVCESCGYSDGVWADAHGVQACRACHLEKTFHIGEDA